MPAEAERLLAIHRMSTSSRMMGMAKMRQSVPARKRRNSQSLLVWRCGSPMWRVRSW